MLTAKIGEADRVEGLRQLAFCPHRRNQIPVEAGVGRAAVSSEGRHAIAVRSIIAPMIRRLVQVWSTPAAAPCGLGTARASATGRLAAPPGLR